MTAPRRERHPDQPPESVSSGRRNLLRAAGGGVALAAFGASAYSTLSQDEQPPTDLDEGTSSTTAVAPAETNADTTNGGNADVGIVEWSMPTSWPTSLPVLWGNTEVFAQRVSDLTGGRFIITPGPAGELSSPIEVLNTVTSADYNVGSTATYYYIEQSPVFAFGTALPFGLSPRQHNAWLYYGGGLQRLREFYASRFNVIQFPAGNTGPQMGGWFNREINSLEDLRGLKMRIPGLGGRVMERLGVETINVGAPDILDALQSGEVDAAEFIGPFDDANLGLQQSAGFYYSPGFWEQNASFDLIVNLDAWNELPPAFQHAFEAAAFESVVRVSAEYDARNGQALNELGAGGTQLRRFPPDVLEAGRAASNLVLDELAAGDPDFAATLGEWRAFRRQVGPWFALEGSEPQA